MGNSVWRNYLTKPHEFDSWVKANAILSSIVATAILGAAWQVSILGHATERPSSQVLIRP
jgi:hypothetical protein